MEIRAFRMLLSIGRVGFFLEAQTANFGLHIVKDNESYWRFYRDCDEQGSVNGIALGKHRIELYLPVIQWSQKGDDHVR